MAESSLETAVTSESEREAGPGVPVWASLSSRGGRAENQDRCGDGPTPSGRAFVVADGLGGHAAGAVAAVACVDACLDALKGAGDLTPDRLHAALDAAQQAVLDAPRRDPAAAGCRTTAVVLEIGGGRAIWGHIGDTRLYHFREGRIEHQTLDHSMPQLLVSSGAIRPEEIRRHPDRNRLLKSLGGEGEAAPSLLGSAIELRRGDAFLLCTDGFWEYVTEDDMLAALAAASGPAAWLDRMESQVLRGATGAFDNYSATAVILTERKAAPAGGNVAGTIVRILAFACLAAVAIQAFQCVRGGSGPAPLVLSSAPASRLPAREGALGPPTAPRLHSVPAEPRGGDGW